MTKKSQKKEVKKSIWRQVMDLEDQDKRHVGGVVNNLEKNEIITILATLDFFGEPTELPRFDLGVVRYRVFDWLAMGVMGRINNENACKVMVYSFLKSEGDVDKFIQDLRETDYQWYTMWENIDLGRKD